MGEESSKIRIHIDREQYESPSHMTGDSLYELGDILPRWELFKSVHGNQEDILILKNNSELDINEDDHFYSQKNFEIIVNGRQKFVVKRKLSFEEIINLAFENIPTGSNVLFTVTFRNGHENKHDGILVVGESIRIKDGMIFNVTATDKS